VYNRSDRSSDSSFAASLHLDLSPVEQRPNQPLRTTVRRSLPMMLSQASICVPLVLLLSSLPSSLATCYLPNGTVHQDEGTSRCSSISSSPLYNTCCQTGWPNPPGGDVKNGPTADECMPNGLCQNRGFSSVPGTESDPWTHYYRVYCANANWEGCLDVCRDGVCRCSFFFLSKNGGADQLSRT
jgi:hypothetical protein